MKRECSKKGNVRLVSTSIKVPHSDYLELKKISPLASFSILVREAIKAYIANAKAPS